ncbi:hypothetical protein [Mogibacterium timidum]
MTKKEMEELISIKQEINAIEMSLCAPKSTYTFAFYKDYKTGYPIPKIEMGYDDGSICKDQLIKKLIATKKKLQAKIIDAEKFIEIQTDSELRTILRSYYINGLSQEEIGKLLGYNQSVISRKISIFWRKQKLA